MPSFTSKKNNSGFTLLEILLVVAAIAILAGIVILAINPTKQLGDTRNAQRRIDVNTISNAVYQYAVDHNGSLPNPIPNSGSCALGSPTNEICYTGGSCADRVNLEDLTIDAKYLVAIPIDPSEPADTGAGYYIKADPLTQRLTVCAPLAEQGATISITR